MGLLALHDRSIVHRDLKPHNVLFTEGMRTKLSDMGLCKRLTTDQTSYDSAGPGESYSHSYAYSLFDRQEPMYSHLSCSSKPGLINRMLLLCLK